MIIFSKFSSSPSDLVRFGLHRNSAANELTNANVRPPFWGPSFLWLVAFFASA